jgi:hypothetical protein
MSGNVALHAVDHQRAGLRAAPADLDHVAEHLDIRGLAEHAMVELLAALGAPFQQLDRAVDRDVFLVAGDQEGDRSFWLAAMVVQILQHRGDAAGDAALHVNGAAAGEIAVLDLAGERAERPRRFVAGRHHVGVAGKGDMRRRRADAGIEVVDIGGAGFGERHAVDVEAGRLQQVFEHTERAGVGRGDGRAANQIAGNRDGINHVSRLTRHTAGGPALCGTISSSLC